MRYIIPDKISLSIGGDISAFLGVGAEPLSFTMLTRGKNPGIYLTPTFHVNAGEGAAVGGGFNLSTGYYTGDPRNITSDMLQGESIGGVLTGGYILDLSIGGSYSPTSQGNGFVNVNVGIGVGFGEFGGFQDQYTPGIGPIWQW